MIPTYVRLTARPATWFKTGTEVFHYDCDPDSPVRLTSAQWGQALLDGSVGVRGIRVCEDDPDEGAMGCAPGEERWDGEWCTVDELEAEVVGEPAPRAGES